MALSPSRPLLLGCALALAGCSDDGTGTGAATDSSSTSLSTVGSTGNATNTTQPTTSTTQAGTEGSGGVTSGTTGNVDPTASSTSMGTVSDGTTTSTTNTSDSTSTTGDASSTGSSSDGGSTGPPPCPKDTLVCEGNTAKVCDGMGGFSSETPCPKVCDEMLGGCVECIPGSHQCNGQVSQVCNNDGKGWTDEETCDGLQGIMCDPNGGQCAGACANLGSSYIGCDYYPVVTQQYDPYANNSNPYAVAVANTTMSSATVTVTQGANQITQTDVPANSVKVIPLPWVNSLVLGTGPSVLVPDGAYRLRSTQPVTVYQFNPLNASVTNDASLMLPVNTWSGNYLVAAWQHWTQVNLPGWYSITASKDNTTVTLTPPKGGQPTQAGAGVDAQGKGVVVLNEGDVLQVITAAGGDHTGTIVKADKPIQVLGGHDCTQVPIGITACDHLEESMFPIEALAKEYIVVPPVQVPNDTKEKAVVVRIVASEDATTLTFDPDQPVNKFLAKAGDFLEIPTTIAKFKVVADKKILVAEYMVGQDGGYGTSDPAMLVAVPTEQFRTSYLFYAQTAWSANYVDIIAPAGAAVQVDGAPVGAFAPIGNSGFSLGHVKLSNAGNGSHTVTSDKKVGISVYGVLNYGSYWYPGGLDLDLIPQ